MDELMKMRSGVNLVRVDSQEAGEEIDRCFCIDFGRRIILDSTELYAIRFDKSTIRLCWMNKNGFQVAGWADDCVMLKNIEGCCDSKSSSDRNIH